MDLLSQNHSTVWSMCSAFGGCHPSKVHPWTIALLGSGKSTTGPPGKNGGMGLVNPVAVCDHEYEASNPPGQGCGEKSKE